MGIENVLNNKFRPLEDWVTYGAVVEFPLARPLVLGERLVHHHRIGICMVEHGHRIGGADVVGNLGIGFGEHAADDPDVRAADEVREYPPGPMSVFAQASDHTWDRFVPLVDKEQSDLTHSERCMWEMMFLHLVADEAGVAPAHLLTDTPRESVPINSLFEGDVNDLQRALDAGEFTNDPCIKIKIGRRSVTDDRAVLDLLHNELANNVMLRLDGNRMLTSKEIAELLKGFPRERIEYLEEPLKDPHALPALASQLNVAIALDESLHDATLKALQTAEGITTWILKPARLGGFSALKKWDTRAAAEGRHVVVSSCFESPLGLSMQAQWAAALDTHVGAAGLATDRWFLRDALPKVYDSRAGHIVTDNWQSTPNVEWLERVELVPWRCKSPARRKRDGLVDRFLFSDDTRYRTTRRRRRVNAYLRTVKRSQHRSPLMNIHAGDIVAIQLDDPARMLAAMLSVIYAGGLALPLPDRNPSVLTRDYLDRGGVSWLLDANGLCKRELPKTLRPTLPDLAAFVVATSGSSGMPKFVVHGLPGLRDAAWWPSQLAADPPRHEQPRWLLSLPLHHMGGLMIALRALFGMGQIDIKPREMPLLDALEHFEPSWISLVPTQLRRLMSAPGGSDALAKCDGVLLGGGPSSLALRREALARDIPLMVSYGATETAAMVASSRNPKHVLHPTCAGTPNLSRWFRCARDGEILVGGDGLALGVVEDGHMKDFFQPPRSFEERTLGSGMYATGDVGRVEDDVLYVEGRKDRMFISGGENIHPETIERALMEHPHVLSCVVVDMPHEEFGARPVAFVDSTNSELNAATLEAFLRDSLPGFLVPDAFYATSDAMRSAIKLSPTKAKAHLHNEKTRRALRPL